MSAIHPLKTFALNLSIKKNSLDTCATVDKRTLEGSGPLKSLLFGIHFRGMYKETPDNKLPQKMRLMLYPPPGLRGPETTRRIVFHS